jgi:transposase
VRPDHFPTPPGKKTICGACGKVSRTFYDHKTRLVRDKPCGDLRIYLEMEVRRVDCKDCGAVKGERLSWLNNPFYTKRFAYYVGKRCQNTTIREVADELCLDWKTVKSMEMDYMREKLKRAGNPTPRVVGMDEISVRKGHNYRIVVSDLERGRPIWFGGKDRTEESLDLFWEELGQKKAEKVRLVVMDMWEAFENSTVKNATQAAILYDKFHVMRKLGEAMDAIRRSEYSHLPKVERGYLKGNRYILLSHRQNLDLKGRKRLKALLAVNQRLNTAYVLKESFGQLWDYKYSSYAEKFFENWKSSLKGQNLKPYEKFSQTVERHWEGIVAHCKPENKVSLGFVEGLNNKIRVIQRRAYGLRDPEYLRLKVLTCTLPNF